MGKCKSSINGSLQQLGYVAQPQVQGIERELLAKIPACSRDLNELKKWTIRKNKDATTHIVSEPMFMIAIPANLRVPPAQVKAEDVQRIVQAKYPCPVKCRYKCYDIMHRCVTDYYR